MAGVAEVFAVCHPEVVLELSEGICPIDTLYSYYLVLNRSYDAS